LFHTSFSPNITVNALCFSNTSLIPTRVRDFHPLVICHARHTKRNKKMKDLFSLYGTSKCTEEEYMEVYNFMCNEPIERFMLKKLTLEELKYAREKINSFKEISDEELAKKVRKEQMTENYQKLSMLDAYVLHMLAKVVISRGEIKSNNELKAQLASNELMRQKGLYYASNPYRKR